MVILLLAVGLGLWPACIARDKGRDFVAWWIYGAALFIVALPHALLLKPDRAAVERETMEREGRKRCPFCAELIKTEANACRYCGRDVPPSSGATAMPAKPTFDGRLPLGVVESRRRWALAICFVIAAAIGVAALIASFALLRHAG